MKRILLAAFAAGIMVTAVNAQTVPATAKPQTTTTQTKTTDRKVEKKEVAKKEMTAPAPKKVKHVHKVHARAVAKPSRAK